MSECPHIYELGAQMFGTDRDDRCPIALTMRCRFCADEKGFHRENLSGRK